MTDYNLPLYRSWFPYLTTGKIWMNHAAISPLSSKVTDALDKYIHRRSVGEIDTFFPSQPLIAETRQNLATMLKCKPERIGFVMNTSDGLNVLTTGLPWQTGDRVILNDSEFPSNVVPFLNLKRLGVEIDFLKTIYGAVTPEIVEAAITPKTKLLSLSFVQFLSGYKADLAAIGEICRRHDIIFCIDAIQGMGVSPLDVGKMNIDFLSCGTAKWLMGCMGIAFIYLSGEMQTRLHQAYAGWTSNSNYFGDFFRYRIDFDATARRFENGTLNLTGITALHTTTDTLLDVGVSKIQNHLFLLGNRLIDLVDRLGYRLITPRDQEHRAGIVTFHSPEAEKIFEHLKNENVIVSLREGMIRISPHFYNAPEEIDRLETILLSFQKNFS